MVLKAALFFVATCAMLSTGLAATCDFGECVETNHTKCKFASGTNPDCATCFSLAQKKDDSTEVIYQKTCLTESNGICLSPSESTQCRRTLSDDTTVCWQCCNDTDNCNRDPIKITVPSPVDRLDESQLCALSCEQVWPLVLSLLPSPLTVAVSNLGLTKLFLRLGGCPKGAAAAVDLIKCFPAIKLSVRLYRYRPVAYTLPVGDADRLRTITELVGKVHQPLASLKQLKLASNGLVSIGVPFGGGDDDRTVTTLMLVADRNVLEQKADTDAKAIRTETEQTGLTDTQAKMPELFKKQLNASDFPAIKFDYNGPMEFRVKDFSQCSDLYCNETVLGFSNVRNPSYAAATTGNSSSASASLKVVSMYLLMAVLAFTAMWL